MKLEWTMGQPDEPFRQVWQAEANGVRWIIGCRGVTTEGVGNTCIVLRDRKALIGQRVALDDAKEYAQGLADEWPRLSAAYTEVVEHMHRSGYNGVTLDIVENIHHTWQMQRIWPTDPVGEVIARDLRRAIEGL